MTGSNDKRVHITRDFNVPVETLFDVCGSPRFFAWCTAILDEGHMDFRVGGTYDYPSLSCQDIEGDFLKGEFKEIVPHRKIVFTWNSMSPAGPTGETLVTLTFTSLGDSTSRLELVHTGFPSVEGAKEHHGGWTEVCNAMAREIEA